MKKFLVILLLLTSCTKEKTEQELSNISNKKIFIQVEAFYKDGNTALSPIVSINQ